jgi:hypothetical protein
MPIYIKEKQTNEILTQLAEGEWELPNQIKLLENWLLENEERIPSEYIADVGFNIRKHACGGGAILSIQAMKVMVNLGITLYLSEYPDD